MLRTLDRYIIRQYLGTFFFILLGIMLIAVVFDMSEKTEDFARNKPSRKEIWVDYYLNFVIYYSNLFSGLLIFIAVLLFTSRLAQRSEFIAMLSGGVSFPRILWPYFLAGTFLTMVSLVVNHLVLPGANRTRQNFEERYVRGQFTQYDKHLFREIAPGSIAYMETWNTRELTGYRFGLEQWRGRELIRKIHADRAKYDTVTGRWTLYDVYDRRLGAQTDSLWTGQRSDTILPLKPSDLGMRWEFAMTMGWQELNAYIEARQAQGDGSAMPYEIEKHQRTSMPFATYVFTLIGVGIASRKVRGGTGVHLALGVMLVLVYVFTMRMTTVAATNAGFDPLAAVWIPNIVFGLVGVAIYRNAPK